MHDGSEMHVRPVWDAAGLDAWLVLRLDRRIDLPGTAWTSWVTYGPLTTKTDLGPVCGQLKHAKAEASRRAREASFVPKAQWRPVSEEAEAFV